MKRTIVLRQSLWVCCVVGILHAASALTLAGTDIDQICAGISNTHQCNAAIEKVQLPIWRDQISREGSVLSVVLATGGTVQLIDDDRFHYRFRECIERVNRCVFIKGGNEYIKYIVIDMRGGRRNDYTALPVYSPDGVRLMLWASTGLYEEAFLEVRSVNSDAVLYRLTTGEVETLTRQIPKCRHETGSFWPGLRRATWVGNGKIRFQLICRDADMQEVATGKVLKQKSDGWVLK